MNKPAASIIQLALILICPSATRAADVLTQHNDPSRTGANLQETVLTPANVNSTQFGKLFTRAVDGYLYAQPLFVQGLTISNQTHNVVFVCTEHNTAYAFDADDPLATNALWQVNLGVPVPNSEVNCSDLIPQIGISGTPVIDRLSSTLYLVAKTKETNNLNTVTNYFHRLHALDITSGQEKFGGPAVVTATVSGITFTALTHQNRPGLLLLSNVVYIAFGSHCDQQTYHGWLLGYNATNLQQVSAFCTTPGGSQGALWSCGMAPAADANGNIYVMTGNGTFDANTGGSDYGQCFLKLSTTNGLKVADWFSPTNESSMNSGDLDIGSGGPVLLPGSHLLVGLCKAGTNYLVDQNNMGHFNSSGDNVVQEFVLNVKADGIGQDPVYWSGPTNQFIYFSSGNGPTKAFNFTGTNMQTTPLGSSSVSQGNRPGGTSLSAYGATNGILWVIDSGSALRAYNAASFPTEVWDTTQNSARDALGTYVKFAAPTVANGKVFVPTTTQLVVYGLLGPPAPVLAWTAASGKDTNWSTALNWTNLTFGGYGPPAFQNNVLFTNAAAVSSPSTANNVVDTSQTIGSLQYANNAVSPSYQVTLISSNKTLLVTNLIVGTSTDAGADNVVNAVITGANGTLILSNNVLAVTQGSGTDGAHQAVLDLSSLGKFGATNSSRIAIGVYQTPPQNGNGGQRSSGVLYLAKTNIIAVTSTGVTNGILVGWNDNQGNGTANKGSALYLGQTNAIFTDAIFVGTDKTLGCLLAFNPSGLNNPTAYFRGIGGASSRVSFWGIGDTSMKSSSNQSASGTNDFTGGAVDAMVGNMTIGVTTTGAGLGPSTGNGSGALTFNSGTIDVNNLTNGWSAGTSTTAGFDVGTGVINVNGSAILKVNNILALAQNTSGGSGSPSGTLNVNGGTVRAKTIVAGGGTSTIAMAGGTLIFTNTAGAPGGGISSLSLSNSTLHLTLNAIAIATNIIVTNLTATGLNTIAFDSIANVSGITTFPLIAYGTFTGAVAVDFARGAVPAGYSAALVDNSGQGRIDLSIAPSALVTPRFGTLGFSGPNLIISGANGLPAGFYDVLVSSDLTLPLNQWAPIATNRFDSSGGFIFTNTPGPNAPQMYYRLQLH
jgi:hypothetical protein